MILCICQSPPGKLDPTFSQKDRELPSSKGAIAYTFVPGDSSSSCVVRASPRERAIERVINRAENVDRDFSGSCEVDRERADQPTGRFTLWFHRPSLGIATFCMWNSRHESPRYGIPFLSTAIFNAFFPFFPFAPVKMMHHIVSVHGQIKSLSQVLISD